MNPTASDFGSGQPGGFADVAFSSIDGTALRGRFWSRPHPRATLLIAHGLGEHGGCYRQTVEALNAFLELDIFAFDFRGSGRSAGKRGVVRRYADYSLDLEAATQWLERERPGLPRFLLGHSNGGLVSLRTLLDRNLGLTGLIVSNPALRLAAHVPIWKRLAGEILLRVAPTITLTTGLTNEQLTHDPAVIAEIVNDPLRHDRISPPLFFGISSNGREVLNRASEIKLPTLLILGGDDPIVAPDATLYFFERLGAKDKILKLYPAMRHEPLNELGRQQVVSDLAMWIEARL